MQDDVEFVMLGSGEKKYEDWMRHLESVYKEKFRGWVGFNVPVSHRITTGCDILAMPSRFEPCGLNQLYAMRYGTIPVVHSIGGLRDNIKNFNPYAGEQSDEGTGYASFLEHFLPIIYRVDMHPLLNLEKLMELYHGVLSID
ncbi:soluble starch synthase 1, chloroplastic amyloplastic [Olea europaea subsp. europaea]|uniref:Soluble starch synthase 1, chloroplastic amyloplastic n=1 Tax=Olea europaea subsp. europaea TaxID=158383 RepID=A0A8S0SIF3_OLEEU|nr:soluble starch synthase 1, chloroplastic amyloplastic [Olea europaea subsp. europaea]